MKQRFWVMFYFLLLILNPFFWLFLAELMPMHYWTTSGSALSGTLMMCNPLCVSLFLFTEAILFFTWFTEVFS